MIWNFPGMITVLVIIASSIALWRWYDVRRKRQPAPHPDTLIQLREPFVIRRKHEMLVISWQEDMQPVMIRYGISREALNRQVAIESDKRQVTIPVEAHSRYFFEMLQADGSRIQTAERLLPLASVNNLRDIGGYQTRDGRQIRWDRIYRSGRLSELGDDDREWMTAQAIRSIYDLRSVEESATHPDRVPPGANYLHLPPFNPDTRWKQILKLLFQYDYMPNFLYDMYIRVMLEHNAGLFRTLFEELANPDQLPAIIHCSAGKDRTGITIALLLSVLGVDDDTICADYSLSNDSHAFFVEISKDLTESASKLGISEDHIRYWLIANPEVMRNTLHHLQQKYGGAEQYLLHRAGINRTILDNLKTNLIE